MLFKDIQKTLFSIYGRNHSSSMQKRLSTLSMMLYSVIRQGHSSLQQIGEGMQGGINMESKVKKCKRWLDSKYTDTKTFFIPFISHLLNGIDDDKELIFIIDGSEVGNGCTALMISVCWSKRSLPICWMVYECKKGHLPTTAHLEVMKLLSELLEHRNQQITFLGDGEFDSADIQTFCISKGWNYVLRTAKSTIIETQRKEQFKVGELYPKAPDEYVFIEEVYFTKERFGPVQCLACCEQKYEQPIYLISNLDDPLIILKLYDKRFSIETIFGDIKSRGFNIHKVRMKSAQRLSNLLIIVCIAYLIAFCLGTFKKQLKPYLSQFIRVDREFQYSVFFIGLKASKYFEKERKRIFSVFYNNIFKYICVRF